MDQLPLSRDTLRALTNEALAKKELAKKAVQQQIAANFVEQTFKPRVLRMAKEGQSQLEIPIMYSMMDVLPELLEAVHAAFPGISVTCKQTEGYSLSKESIYLDWS
jgi:hypothetical protein